MNNQASEDPTMLNNIWTLVKLNEQNINAENFVRGVPQIEIHLEKNQIFGNTGCNRLNGNIELMDQNLVLSNIATTRMACIGPSIETEFLIELAKSPLQYAIKDDQLILSKDSNILMVFEKSNLK